MQANFSNNLLTKLQLINLPKLYYVGVSNNQLRETYFENLPMLRNIYLSKNRLKEIQLENLPGLLYVDLSKNQLTEEPIVASTVRVKLDGNPYNSITLCHLV